MDELLRSLVKRAGVTALCAALVLGASPALAQDPKPAAGEASGDGAASPDADPNSFAALVKRAGEKYGQKDYLGAAEDFKKAYAVEPRAPILYNIGRIYEQAGKFPEAVTYYKQFVRQPGVKLENRKDALERIKNLEEVIALDAKKDDPKVTDPKVTDPKTTDPKVTDPKTTDPKVTEPVKKQPEPLPPNRTPAYIALGVGGVALIGAGVFGLMAGSEHDAFDSATTLQARRDAASAGERNAMVGDVLLGVGVASAIVGVVLFVTASPEEAPKQQPASGQLTPQVSPTSVGVGWSARF